MTDTLTGESEEQPCCSGLARAGWILFILLAIGAALFVSGTFETSGRVVLRTVPAGATVFVNGKLAGATPLVITDLQFGSYCLRLEKEGFTPLVVPVHLKSAEVQLKENLQARGVGTLVVGVRPHGAEVLLDGEFIGYTPVNRSDIPVGTHDLLIRKTNFKSYAQRIEVTSSEPLAFKDFALEDVVLTMLRGAVDREKHRVSNYMDLGHYLFVNNELDESAEVYAKALQVAAAPLEFPPGTDETERRLEQRLRAEDTNRLNEEIRKKSHWPNKDVTKWTAILKRQQEEVAGRNVTDWVFVNEQVDNFKRDEKFERAQSLLLQHIQAVKNGPMLPQAYIALMSLRLRMKNMEGLRETFSQFMDLYENQPTLVRQAGNAVYTMAGNFQGDDQKEILVMAEKLMRKGVTVTQRMRGDPELLALCKFELGNVMMLQGRSEESVALYRESIDGTRDASTRELRSQRLVEAFTRTRNYTEAKKVLTNLAKSTREDIARKAREDLQNVDQLLKEEQKQKQIKEPSPEQK
ncbi:MAG TPA: PEGA domain-containing protein [Planctomycetota bacterium]|nr:PEGA domain-containing protein [Planctomycetota bacterium]